MPTAPVVSHMLPASRLEVNAYPPSDQPYWIEPDDFWLVHTPEGQLFAFVPVSPEYVTGIGNACRYTWEAANGRFIDPCSGDEWELNGTLNLAHSSELWSNRDLDQYWLQVQEDGIFVQRQYQIPGMPVEPMPINTAQYGVTITVALATFTPLTTTIDTWVLVDPIWDMDASDSPPQLALTNALFPDSLIDDQGRVTAPSRREGAGSVPGPHAGGLRALLYHQWEAVAPDARVVTATLTVDLSALHREITLPVNWDSLEEGDVWAADFPLEIGHAAAQIQQIEWRQTTADGRVVLRMAVTDESPEDIRLYCLHLEVEDPWPRECPNFNGEGSYTVAVPPGEPVNLHLRASLELLTPFQLVIDVAPFLEESER